MKVAKPILIGAGLLTLLFLFRNQVSNAYHYLIKQFEGLRLQAYQDTGGVWTIGYGFTYYPNGEPVRPGDTITQAQADEMYIYFYNLFAQQVEDLITSNINNNQFAALVSLAYNIGINAFRNSTILEMVNQEPNNPEIRNQFLRWIYDNGQIIQGLINRREQEANIYFS